MNALKIIIAALAILAVAVSVTIRVIAVLSCLRSGADLDKQTWKRIEHWRE